MPFLEDLRQRLYVGVVLFASCFVVGFLSANIILKAIITLVTIDDVVLAASSPFQLIEVAMNIGFFLAILITTPYVLYSLYVFILPALTKGERTELLKSIPMAVILFALGCVYGFYVLYYALGLLAAVNTSLGIASFWNIGQFLSQILVTSTLLGLVFLFPVVLTFLIKIKIMTSATLKKHRRIAYFLLLFMAVLLPPTDGLSLLALVAPLLLLYEATITLNAKLHV